MTRGATRIVGIDEAGRGAWLGPLVVGAVAVEARALPAIREAGARDSKALAPEEREEVYGRLERIAQTRSIALPPREIDRHVVRGQLNALEAKTFADLIVELAPEVAYVDACDPNARRFGRVVAALAGGAVRVVARHRADVDHPLVGAASIVAKVRRDRAIAELARELGAEIGSGYPSDPRTIEFVRRRCGDGPQRPEWMRASWATTQRVIPDRSARPLEAFGP